MDNADIKHTEEREYYRINDTVELSHYIIPDHIALTEVDQTLVDAALFAPTEAKQFHLMQSFSEIDERLEKMLHENSREHPKLSECIHLINKKLHSLAHLLVQTNQQPKQLVNLSAGGLAFQSPEDIASDTRLKLKVILQPSLQGFICSAKVVQSHYLPKKDPERPYRIAVKFLDLRARQERLLQRHILQRQTEKFHSKTN